MMTKVSDGTTPPGTAGEEQAASWVRQMFADIAPKYDTLNHLLSFNVDRSWRKALIRQLAPVLGRQDATVLDLCCGTGDVLLDLQSVSAARVLGADFCHPMLLSAQAKSNRTGFTIPLFEGDALDLPLAGSTLDAVSIAFGFRNLTSYTGGLRELHRVLKPAGSLAILEFSHPPGMWMKAAYAFYSRVALPAIGKVVSGSGTAYSYLPDSISKFPRAEELRWMMIDAGFEDVRFELLTGGVAALHIGLKVSGQPRRPWNSG